MEKLTQCQQRHEEKLLKRSGVKLPVALEILQQLCDSVAAGCGASGESAITLVDDGNTPRSSGVALSQGLNTPYTPVRVPSVLTLFRTPPPPLVDCDDEDLNKSLRVRLMKGKKQGGDSTPRRKFRSCMSWAPENLSPVQCVSPNVEGPVLGPTLGKCFSPVQSASPSIKGPVLGLHLVCVYE